MAGVPGQSPAQKMAALQASMQPGDYIMDGQIVRGARRDTDQSILNTVGQLADKYLGVGGDRRRSRLLAGLASQWYGLDESGNPTAGKTPGIVYETKALGAMPTMLARAGLDTYTGWFAKNVMGEDPDKVLQDPTYNMVKQAMLADPEWATNAADKADAIHKAVREDMRLKAPKGFAENAQEAAGVMLGQIPVPGKAASKAIEEAPGILSQLGRASEWFTPTVEAKPVNYGVGAVTGGALGAMGDSPDETPVVIPSKTQPGLSDVRPVYSDNSVGYSGSPEDQAALEAAQAEQGHADGGKVGSAGKLIAKYLEDNGDGLYIGNNKKYMALLHKYMSDQHVPTKPEDLDIIEPAIRKAKDQLAGKGKGQKQAFDKSPNHD